MNNNYKMVDISFIVQWMKKFNIVFTWFKENGNLMQQEKDTMIKTILKKIIQSKNLIFNLI